MLVLCILESEEGLLLLKRGKEPNKDLYTPVGGKIEAHEEPKDAAVREIFEETQQTITVDDLRLRGFLTESSPTKNNWISFVFSAWVEPFAPGYCSEGILEWIKPERLGTIPAPETDRYICDYVERGNFFAFDAKCDAENRLLKLTENMTGTVVYEREDEV